jgi:hypothetical protein
VISQTVIEEVKRRLIEVYDPAKIYLFGSYAWGVPHEESDEASSQKEASLPYKVKHYGKAIYARAFYGGW